MFQAKANKRLIKTYASAPEQKISPSESRIKSVIEIIALMSLLKRQYH